ncbi:MAG: nitroreductase family protein [Dysgonomonas sp.]
MDFFNIAKSRYTTKKYNSSEKISEDKIEQLKEILRLSPSSINSQPWKFTFVSDENLKDQLAKASYFNEHKVKDASHLVIFSVIDNIEKFEKQIQNSLPEGNVAYYMQKLKPQSDNVIKSWLAHQVYLSLGFFLGACASMDIDSTSMEGINADEYTEILQQNDYKPLFAVAIGYRDQQDENQPSITPKSRLDIINTIESI